MANARASDKRVNPRRLVENVLFTRLETRENVSR